MKKTLLLSLITLISLITLNSQISFSQIRNEPKFYIGLGTSLSSYIGGDFGSTFAIRYSTTRDDYFYDNNYYNRPYSYNEMHNTNQTMNPLQVDLALGMNISKVASFQIESSFLWHTNGRVNRDYQTGTTGDLDYIDRYDNASVIAVPIIASVKIYPFSKKKSSFYLSGGYGIQYMHESVDRVRTVYDYNSYQNNYYSSKYEYLLAEYNGREWIHGFKVGAGFTYNILKGLSGEVELKVTNFYPTVRDNTSNLSIYRTPNITNISLGTKIYLGL